MKNGKKKIAEIRVINKENGEVVCEWEWQCKEVDTIVSLSQEQKDIKMVEKIVDQIGQKK